MLTTSPHSARPGKYQRRQSNHIPLGGVVRSEPLHICDVAPVVFLGMRGLAILFVTFAALLKVLTRHSLPLAPFGARVTASMRRAL